MNGIRPHFPWRIWIPACLVVIVLTAMTEVDVYNQMRSQAPDTIKHRIAAILAVNGKMSGDVDGQKVDLDVYLRSICDDLAASFEQKLPGAQLDASLSSILCDGEKAVRLGLIVNELVTKELARSGDMIVPKPWSSGSLKQAIAPTIA